MKTIDLLKNDNLLYYIEKSDHKKEKLQEILENHKEIRFVSLAGFDLKGNATDERIPLQLLLDDYDDFIKSGVQTDGSSVELQKIATLNDAKVVILPDIESTWYIDYNFDYTDEETGKPVGTLWIPSYLIHNEKKVGSRSVLIRALDNVKNQVKNRINSNEKLKHELGIDEKIREVKITTACELEFWVKTPEEISNQEELTTSQVLKEQYWKATEGSVRTALEYTLQLMGKYGFEPEMGHKEVGGVRSKLKENGDHDHIMEQLEIDWKYSSPMRTADSVYFIKHLISEVFNFYGMEVTFEAKPVQGVAGSGAHAHIGLTGILESGKVINIFNHKNMNQYYLSSIGLASLAGILKNYEVINPFVTATTDSFKRLKPGFEAPVCIVTSLGKSPQIPSRNRSILIGLIKNHNSPMQTRFELRATNPNSNMYLTFAATFQAMLDGIRAYVGKYDVEFLQKEISKGYGEKAVYLEKDRVYRSEENVFTKYTQEERDKYFSKPPATVYENIQILFDNKDKLKVLTDEDVFTRETIDSYIASTMSIWDKELKGRIVENYRKSIRKFVKLHDYSDDVSDLDIVLWSKIEEMKWELMKDKVDKKSLLTQIVDLLNEKDYEQASKMQIEISEKMSDLTALYNRYKKNIF